MKQLKLVLLLVLALACMLLSLAGCGDSTDPESTGSDSGSTNSEVDSGIVPPSDIENEIWGVEVNTYFTIPSELTGEPTYVLTDVDGQVLPTPTVDRNRIFFDTMGNYTLTVSAGSVEKAYKIKVTDTTAPIFYKTTSEISLTVGLVCDLASLAQATDNSGCEVTYEYEAWYLGTEKEVFETSAFRPKKVGFYTIKIKAIDAVGNYFITRTKMNTIKSEDGEICFFEDNTREHNGGSIPTNTVCEYDDVIKIGNEGYSWKFAIHTHNCWTYTTIDSAIDLTNVDTIIYYVYIDSNSFTVGNADPLKVDVLPRPNGWNNIEVLSELAYNTWITVIARRGDTGTTYSSTITFMTPNTNGDWYGTDDWENCSHAYSVRIDRISAYEYAEPDAPTFTRTTPELVVSIGQTLDLTTLAEATASSAIKYEYAVWYLGTQKVALESTDFATRRSGLYFVKIKATDAEGRFSFTTTKVKMQSFGIDEICFFDDNTIEHTGPVGGIPTNTVCEYDDVIKLGNEGYSYKFVVYGGWTYVNINSLIDLTNVTAISYYVYIDSSSFTAGNADPLKVDVLPRPNWWNDIEVLSGGLAYDTWMHVVARKGSVDYTDTVTFMTPNTDGDWYGTSDWDRSSHAFVVRIDHISAYKTVVAPTFTKTTAQTKAIVGEEFDLSTLAEATASSAVTYKYEAWYLGTEKAVLEGPAFTPAKAGYYIIKIKAMDADYNYSFAITKLVTQNDSNSTNEICSFDDNRIKHTPLNAAGQYSDAIKRGDEGYSWKVNVLGWSSWGYTTFDSTIDLTNVTAISYYVYVDSSSFTAGNADPLNLNVLPCPSDATSWWWTTEALTPIAYDTWIHVVATKGTAGSFTDTLTLGFRNDDYFWFGGDFGCSHEFVMYIDDITVYTA